MADAEVSYYRAVEDHFARLRGTPFLFTPKDFGLLRRWWQDGVPLAAVLAGIGEVMARRAAAGEDPVSSLSYCRHAVSRHARRLQVAAVGAADVPSGVDVPARLAAYASAARRAAESVAGLGEAAAALDGLAAAVLTLPPDAPPAALEVTAASLEASAFPAMLRGLPGARRDALMAAIRAREDAFGEGGPLPAAARLAILLQTVREELDLPRLDLVSDAPQD
jgi:hypothetical protein